MGQARVRGELFFLDEKVVSQFSWGLGHVTNNQAVFLAQWKGLKTYVEINVKNFLFFND